MARGWTDIHSPKINHQSVVKDTITDVEITPGYFLALNVANLIALCGLLLGSSPVIIGVMIISSLMGPVLSFGFAFVTSDETIWRQAIRKFSSALPCRSCWLASPRLFPIEGIDRRDSRSDQVNLYVLNT